ncbi:hypothetical protein MK852_13820 [Shewanella benthica]|uniref:hypothetical protein n=1 Tax=Shewanella benthica TaxID=43661 RepID=UPI00187A76CF|nr:hypothetical protein [Shewanella benthica]MBE7214742.1 hypothetical protein [Shewanella benthica]MCL1063186.1 hypothetical protein [Shewanella benthica]
MNSAPDKQVLQQVQSLLAPYAKESLSAFDNMKLVIAILSAHRLQNLNDSANPEPSIAYEVTLRSGAYSDIEDKHTEIDDDNSKSCEQFYCVKWQGIWIHCGLTNDYSASIQLLTHADKVLHIKEHDTSDDKNEHAIGKGTLDIMHIETSSLRQVNVPVLSLQQVEFMCMEYAHFDHC